MSRVQQTPVYLVLGERLRYLPTRLGLLACYAKAYRGGVLADRFAFIPVSGSLERALGLERVLGRGVWLFSNYTWSEARNEQIAAAVKARNPANLTVFGGPQTPSRAHELSTYLAERGHVDLAVRGEGEQTLAELLERLPLEWTAGEDWREPMASLPGASFRDAETGELRRGPDRPRLSSLGDLPSPLLSGFLDPWVGSVRRIVLETNRGCPYGCTFCDWGSLTQQKIKQFDLERVKEEITWCGANGVKSVFVADANFGIFERDVEIAEHFVETRRRYGFPRSLTASYAKNANDRVSEIIKLWRGNLLAEGVVSLQTMDPETLRVVRRSNIKPERLTELVEVYRREAIPLSAELIAGLPGSTLQSFEADLQQVTDLDVGARIYPALLLRNSPMADPGYMDEHRIEADATGRLVSTATYTPADLARVHSLAHAYRATELFGVARYVLRYLQWERGVSAVEFFRAIVDRTPATLSWLREPFEVQRARLAELYEQGSPAWGAFYGELERFCRQTFELDDDEPLAVVLAANRAVMPYRDRALPDTVELAHDFAAYYLQRTGDPSRSTLRLADFSPGRLEVRDPAGLCSWDAERRISKTSDGQISKQLWELESEIYRPRISAVVSV